MDSAKEVLKNLHVALLGATLNEISGENAHALVEACVKIVPEGFQHGAFLLSLLAVSPSH